MVYGYRGLCMGVMKNRLQLLCTSLVFAMVSSAIARACLQATLCLLYLSLHLVHRPFLVHFTYYIYIHIIMSYHPLIKHLHIHP
jgi:hypothetical protein